MPTLYTNRTLGMGVCLGSVRFAIESHMIQILIWVQDDVARYLKAIVPPVLACFTDQDARVRYYACESMYNIAKVAKGEILLFFNDVFDALCKVRSHSEPPVWNTY